MKADVLFFINSILNLQLYEYNFNYPILMIAVLEISLYICNEY